MVQRGHGARLAFETFGELLLRNFDGDDAVEDFMFQLSSDELENWRSQIATSNPAVRHALKSLLYASGT